jgi:hypothetical protein
MAGFVNNFVTKVWVAGGETNGGDNALNYVPVLQTIAAGATFTSDPVEIGYGADGFTIACTSNQASTLEVTYQVFTSGRFDSSYNWVDITPAIYSQIHVPNQWYLDTFTPPACRIVRFKVRNAGGPDAGVRCLLMYGG